MRDDERGRQEEEKEVTAALESLITFTSSELCLLLHIPLFQPFIPFLSAPFHSFFLLLLPLSLHLSLVSVVQHTSVSFLHLLSSPPFPCLPSSPSLFLLSLFFITCCLFSVTFLHILHPNLILASSLFFFLSLSFSPLLHFLPSIFASFPSSFTLLSPYILDTFTPLFQSSHPFIFSLTDLSSSPHLLVSWSCLCSLFLLKTSLLRP